MEITELFDIEELKNTGDRCLVDSNTKKFAITMINFEIPSKM